MPGELTSSTPRPDPSLERSAPTLAADGPTPRVGDTAPGRLERGATVGRYLVLERLGEGGMGLVYAAYDPELDRKIALKLLKARTKREGRDSSGGRSRLLREAQAIAKLSHPNVIGVYDVGVLDVEHGDERVFIAMEFIDGLDLAQWLVERRKSSDWQAGDAWREVVDLFLQAGRGLEAAHAAGVIHRDFKPENVLLGHDGRVRVLDFGLARKAMDRSSDGSTGPQAAIDTISVSGETDPVSSNLGRADTLGASGLDARLTRTGALLGTPVYMAPEQHQAKLVDERSDQFAFCVSLYEALWGQRPFLGDTVAALTFQMLHGKVREPPAKPSVPKRIRRLVMRGLSIDPEQRFASMSALLAELAWDPRVRLRRWGAAIGALTVVGALSSAVYAATRPGIVHVNVTYDGVPLRPSEVQVGEHALEPSEAGAHGEVPAGLYRMVVRAPGFLEHEQVLEVSRNATFEIGVSMEHEKGVFELEVEPEGATVLVDGIDYGSRLRQLAVETGDHELWIKKEGHYDRRLTWTARHDETQVGFAFLPRAKVWSATASGTSTDLLWVGDMTGDGRPELVHNNFATLKLYDPWTDRRLDQIQLGQTVGVTASFADLDGDGALEPVALMFDGDVVRLVAFSSKRRPGRYTPAWSVKKGPFGPARMPIVTRPRFVDANGDGTLDPITTGVWGPAIAVHSGKSGKALWWRDTGSRGLASIVTDELVVGLSQDGLHAYEAKSGRPRWIAPIAIPEPSEKFDLIRILTVGDLAGRKPLIAANLDDDPGLDIVAITPWAKKGAHCQGFAGGDGSRLWDVGAVEGGGGGFPEVADATGDGRDDVLLSADGQTRLIDGATGETVWSRDGGSNGFVAWSEELLVAARGPDKSVVLLAARDGSVRATLELPERLRGAPALSDWDGDGTAEIVLATNRAVRAFRTDGTAVGSIELATNPRIVVPSGDQNGDGLDDLLVDANGPMVLLGPKVRWRRSAADALRGGPVVADVDGDGKLEAALVGQFRDGPELLHIFDAATGELDAVGTVSGIAIRAPEPIPRDDGGFDLAVQMNQFVRVFSGRDATVLREHKVGEAYGGPAYLDVDGDGGHELVVTPWEPHPVRVLDAETLVEKWRSKVEGGSWARPRIVELADGRRTMLTAMLNGTVALLAGTGETLWERDLGSVKFDYLPAVGDLDGDGKLELVTHLAGTDPDLVGLSAETGRELWRRRDVHIGATQIVLHDVDGDGRLEIIAGTSDRGVLCLDHDRRERWRYDFVGSEGKASVAVHGTIVVDDLEGDGTLELVVPFGDGSLRVLDAATGELRWGFQTGDFKIEAPPVTGDVDGDGIKEVFVAGWDRRLTCLRSPRASVSAAAE